jgi:hypothetical protein
VPFSVATLLTIVRARSGESGGSWLEATCARAGGDVDALCSSYTAASARVGRIPLALAVDERHPIEQAAPGLDASRWTTVDAARTALLISAAERLPPSRFVDAATACFERGDASEQQSWLRGIMLVPEPDRFLRLAIDACRTNIVPLFESIACENPYPARFFPERNFNQLVLKALFNGIALTRIVGRQGRLNAELSRMAGDYAAERRAAGRTVPADIGLAMTETGSAGAIR